MLASVWAQSDTPSEIIRNIYVEAEYSYPCTRLLYQGGQIGCTSKRGGNAGTLYLIDDVDSLNNVHHAPKDAIITLDASYFNKTIIDIVRKQDLNGILVLTDTTQNYAYSPDYSQPNKKYGLYPNSNYVWNTAGDGLNFESFDFPIFAIGFNTSEVVRSYAIENRNGKYPQWGAHLDSFMHAALDAESCLRRGFCTPLGGKSSWATFSESIDPLAKKDILLVTVPMDSNAFFHDMAIGAETTTYAQTVLLTLIKALSKIDRSQWNLEVIFALFDGERWGYLGSTKFVSDVTTFKCDHYTDDTNTACQSPFVYDLSFLNISMSSIKYIVELNQIGNPTVRDPNTNAYVLALNPNQLPEASANQAILNGFFSTIITDFATQLGVTAKQVDASVPELPPSSSMAFVRANPSVGVIVVTDHFGPYTNPYFNSHNDVASNTNTQILGDTVTLFANIIDKIAGGNNTGNIEVDTGFANKIFDCLSVSFSCDLVETMLSTYPYNTYPNFYTSVFGTSEQNQVMTITAQFFHQVLYNLTASYTSGAVCHTTSDCEGVQVCLANHCTVSNTHFHDSISLAFTYDDKSLMWKITNNSYPTMVESNWDYTFLKFYQQDNKTAEVLFLVYGLLQFIGTIVVIFFVKKYLSKRYKLL
eukprot:gene2642-3047_t